MTSLLPHYLTSILLDVIFDNFSFIILSICILFPNYSLYRSGPSYGYAILWFRSGNLLISGGVSEIKCYSDNNFSNKVN